MTKPQQPELGRSGRGQQNQGEWARRQEARPSRGDAGESGPVPEENRPGHHPEEEQDKPQGPPPT